jgi:signal transduction histidine kinase
VSTRYTKSVLSTLILVGDVAPEDREKVATLLGTSHGVGASDAGSRVTIAASFEDGFAKLKAASFDLVVLDASVAATRLVREAAPRAAIIGLVEDDAAGALAVEAGADDWIARDELVPRAFRRVLRHAIHVRRSLESERSRDDMLSVISHDLRNPLNVITVAVASLRQGTIPAERVPNYLDKVRRAADRMNRLIQDVLDVSRLESRRIAFDRTPQAVEKLVADAVELARPVAQEKSVTLGCEVEAGLPATFVDRERILQLFSNLLTNAIKATASGGTVTLAAVRDGGAIRFDVRDTGVGIAPDQMPHIFDRHHQARRTDRQGAGLGLTIAQQIAIAHDGKISADSEPGKGTTFHVTLPTVASHPAGAVGQTG